MNVMSICTRLIPATPHHTAPQERHISKAPPHHSSAQPSSLPSVNPATVANSMAPESSAFLITRAGESDSDEEGSSGGGISENSLPALSCHPSLSLSSVQVAHPDESLLCARDRMTARGLRQLPVVIPEDVIVERAANGHTDSKNVTIAQACDESSNGVTRGTAVQERDTVEILRYRERGAEEGEWGSNGRCEEWMDGEWREDEEDSAERERVVVARRFRVVGLLDREDIALACR